MKLNKAVKQISGSKANKRLEFHRKKKVYKDWICSLAVEIIRFRLKKVREPSWCCQRHKKNWKENGPRYVSPVWVQTPRRDQAPKAALRISPLHLWQQINWQRHSRHRFAFSFSGSIFKRSGKVQLGVKPPAASIRLLSGEPPFCFLHQPPLFHQISKPSSPNSKTVKRAVRKNKVFPPLAQRSCNISAECW